MSPHGLRCPLSTSSVSQESLVPTRCCTCSATSYLRRHRLRSSMPNCATWRPQPVPDPDTRCIDILRRMTSPCPRWRTSVCIQQQIMRLHWSTDSLSGWVGKRGWPALWTLTLIHPASPMHRATRWRHECLSWADVSTSSKVNPILWRSFFTTSLQFILGLPGLLLNAATRNPFLWGCVHSRESGIMKSHSRKFRENREQRYN